MIKLARGELDSPIANRGCLPRSSRTTFSPMRCATMDSNDPANPDPIMARSKSGFIDEEVSNDGIERCCSPPQPRRGGHWQSQCRGGAYRITTKLRLCLVPHENSTVESVPRFGNTRTIPHPRAAVAARPHLRRGALGLRKNPSG